MIETRLLQQFVAVAEELHFHRAAQRLHMAQPPLSQAIRRLESEIGHTLLERSNRTVALTPAGAAFLVRAREILQSLNDSVAQTRRVARGLEGQLTLTFINIAAYAPLLQALRRFRQASPGVTFTLREATTHEQVDALEQGSADLGFMRPPGRSSPVLHQERLLREPLYVVLPAGHALAGQTTIALADLKDEAFVCTPRSQGQGFHDQLMTLCQTAGFLPKVVQQARQLQTLVALVAAGFGLALVPASACIPAREGVAFRVLHSPVATDALYMDLLMVWNTRQTSPIRERLAHDIRCAFVTHHETPNVLPRDQ